MKKNIFIFTFFLMSAGILQAQEIGMVHVKEGSFVPLYGASSKKPVFVPFFYLDIYPVTNSDFLKFIKKNPDYSKSKIKRIFAEKSYLSYWRSDYDFGTADPKSPVTSVSWFAAKKYCECQGKRLATMDEWEYAAMADEKRTDARTKKEFNEYILSWYEKSKTYENPIGQTFKNYWGIYDMHGLIWEWTADFNSIFLSGESRKDKSNDKNLFCGSASVNATDLMDYAAFMRYAFRGSLKAQYATRNLGFRCASTTKPKI
ncbi:formylglycine-generating enzyme family protein [Flavobacterium procerum]|uniref:Formylglycine-generating enzyme family protein n=1 Tax=Flavobacterium procerum TaxID=1455569 RepID=A0ABV6BN98_9FLAO